MYVERKDTLEREGRIPLPMSATPIVILENDGAMGDTISFLCKTAEKTNHWSRLKWYGRVEYIEDYMVCIALVK